MKVTVLDDYQRAFENTDAIQRLRRNCRRLHILPRSYPSEGARRRRAQRLASDHSRCASAPSSPRRCSSALPDLEFISQTGNHVYHVDYGGGDQSRASSSAWRRAATARRSWPSVLMLAVMRRIPQSDRAMRRGEWPLVLGYVLEGKTLGILGLGKIGTEVAAIARAFGMKVIAWGPTLTAERAAKSQATFMPLDEFSKSAMSFPFISRFPNKAGTCSMKHACG